ncbi:dynein regulatory complex protein 9 [Varanus komodoensis]|uniref:dynein regulatory complex protein 9 n=1 Tax=Varanus komodoensis TaxID=61221 RepID=UPI001CF7750D|nr:dynein regulatory complex protein 9 [Varanus komodoensis]
MATSSPGRGPRGWPRHRWHEPRLGKEASPLRTAAVSWRPVGSAQVREAQVQLKPAKLTPLDAVRLSALLEDCTDQLTILGYIMPVSYEGRKDVSNLDEMEIKNITENQKALSIKYKTLMDTRAESQAKVPLELGKIADLGRQLQETSSDLKRSNHLFNMATKQSAVSADNLKKVQADRQQANDVLEDSKDELLTLGTFHTLQLAVSREKDLRAHIQNLIFREEMGRKKIKCLQKQLSDVKKEMDFEVQNRNEMIAYLKDQLQEMKAKTDMESRYVKKDTELQVAQVQKRCSAAENDLQNEIEKLRNQTEQEIRVHLDIESFLKQQQMSIEEKLEYWMEKYEKDTEAKQQALNALKSSRAADQAALQELAKQCLACEQAIIEDRKEKERARKKVEQDALEAKSLLKLQAWWRGMMVRRFLGPYKNLKKALEEEPTAKDKGKKGKGKPGAKKKK